MTSFEPMQIDRIFHSVPIYEPPQTTTLVLKTMLFHFQSMMTVGKNHIFLLKQTQMYRTKTL